MIPQQNESEFPIRKSSGQKNPQGVINGMAQKNRELSLKVDELEQLATAMAQAEHDYNMAYAEKLLRLKADGNAITLCQTLAKGDKYVADMLFKYRVAEAVYDAGKKKIHSLDTAIDTYRSLLSWYKIEYSQGA